MRKNFSLFRQVVQRITCVVVSMMVAACAVKADGRPVVHQGRCGDNLNFTLDDNGLFKVTGTGDMYDSLLQLPEWTEYKEEIKTLELGEGVVSVGKSSFSDCFNLERVQCPSTLRTIKESAFLACTSLIDPGWNEGLMEIGNFAYSGCYSLERVDLPSTVTSIGSAAFSHNIKLLAMSLPGGLEKISSNVAWNCGDLKSVVVQADRGSRAATRGDDKFIVEEQAFRNSGIESITLPDNLEIKDDAFNDCDNLKVINVESNVPLSAAMDADFEKGECVVPSRYASLLRYDSWMTDVTISDADENAENKDEITINDGGNMNLEDGEEEEVVSVSGPEEIPAENNEGTSKTLAELVEDSKKAAEEAKAAAEAAKAAAEAAEEAVKKATEAKEAEEAAKKAALEEAEKALAEAKAKQEEAQTAVEEAEKIAAEKKTALDEAAQAVAEAEKLLEELKGKTEETPAEEEVVTPSTEETIMIPADEETATPVETTTEETETPEETVTPVETITKETTPVESTGIEEVTPVETTSTPVSSSSEEEVEPVSAERTTATSTNTGKGDSNAVKTGDPGILDFLASGLLSAAAFLGLKSKKRH